MKGKHEPSAEAQARLDPDALLCSLVLLPNAISRNKFFSLFEDPVLARVRRRAKRVRALVRQILGQGRQPADIVGQREQDDRVLLRLQIADLNYQRTTSLSQLEGSLVRYALYKRRGDTLKHEDRLRVERALEGLQASLLAARPPAPQGHDPGSEPLP